MVASIKDMKKQPHDCLLSQALYILNKYSRDRRDRYYIKTSRIKYLRRLIKQVEELIKMDLREKYDTNI